MIPRFLLISIAIVQLLIGRLIGADQLPLPQSCLTASMVLEPETSNYMHQTQSPTRDRLLLNGIWKISNAAKIAPLNPFDKKLQINPLQAFAIPPLNEKTPDKDWENQTVPLSEYDSARGLDWYHTQLIFLRIGWYAAISSI